jgi:hypothetical protein
VIGLSAVVAPIVGGALVDADLPGSGWRAIFLVNLPLGVVGMLGALRVMPRTAGDRSARLDPVGASLATLACVALIYPLVQGRELGWPLWCFALVAAGAAGFAVGAAGDVSSWTLVPGELLAGMGMAVALPPLFDFILGGVQGHEVGSASGVLNSVQQLGAALGIAVLATIFFAYVDHGHPATEAMTGTALLSLVPLGLALLASWLLPRRTRELGPVQ